MTYGKLGAVSALYKNTIPAHVARIDKVLAEAVGRDLSSWERNEFLPSIRQRSFLTPRQEESLARIERRVYDTTDDCA